MPPSATVDDWMFSVLFRSDSPAAQECNRAIVWLDIELQASNWKQTNKQKNCTLMCVCVKSIDYFNTSVRGSLFTDETKYWGQAPGEMLLREEDWRNIVTMVLHRSFTDRLARDWFKCTFSHCLHCFYFPPPFIFTSQKVRSLLSAFPTFCHSYTANWSGSIVGDIF